MVSSCLVGLALAAPQAPWPGPRSPSPAVASDPAAAPAERRDSPLPRVASGVVHLARGGLSVSFRPRGVGAVTGVPTDEGMIYPGAWDGADLEYVRIDGGVEDRVWYAARPAEERQIYDLALTGVAGLRLVADVLELLDPAGTPALRVRAPYVVDAYGDRHPARLEVSGCDADRDPRPPWGRPVTPPGADVCAVEVSWGATLDGPIAYPAMVDPAWVTADTLVVPRNAHVVVPMADGRALVAGGFDAPYATNYTPAAELFDGVSATFATLLPMSVGRGNTGGAELSTGEVLIAAGDDQLFASAERWDPATGDWSPTSAPSVSRDWAEVAPLPDGRALLVGGCTEGTSTCTAVSAEGEVYDPLTDTWTVVGGMSDGRAFFTLTPLTDGRVVAAGGCHTFDADYLCYTTSFTADVFDPTTDTWTALPDIPLGGHQDHAASALADGGLLLLGGSRNGYLTSDVHRWDPVTGSWTSVAPLLNPHANVGAALLPDGGVLIAGHGWFDFDGSAEIFDPLAASFTAIAPIQPARADMPTVRLADGRILIAGGYGFAPDGQLRESGRADIYDARCDDEDGDTVCDEVDRCPGADDTGPDTDGDGVADICDRCVDVAHPANTDADGDGVGDACDPCPAPEDPIDSDGDGVCDGREPPPDEVECVGASCEPEEACGCVATGTPLGGWVLLVSAPWLLGRRLRGASRSA